MTLPPPLGPQVRVKTKRLWDQLERIGWTILQVVGAEVLVQLLDLPQPWVIPITGILVTIKTSLASKFGTASAATLPAKLDAAA